MIHFKWITMLLFVIQVLQFTVSSQHSYIAVRHGDDVTLLCENMTHQHKCDRTTWLFSGSGNTAAVSLFEHGKIHKDAKSKSVRLSVTENCSLIIKKVTDEDVGRYTCRQFNESGQQQGSDSAIDLSVVTMTEHKHGDNVTLNCSVRTHGPCGHTVKWLLNKKEVEKDKKTSQSTCSANVTNSTAHFFENSKIYECNVTRDNTRKVELFPFRRQSSGEGTGKNVDGTMQVNLNSAEIPNIPETSEATVDPEDGVSYVYISFSKNGRSEIQNKDDRGEAVTYSTVMAPSSSSSAVAASTDPSILYATAH